MYQNAKGAKHHEENSDGRNQRFGKERGCGECQTSCQSACKTSCGVANQQCENAAKEEAEKISALAAAFFQLRGDGEPGDDFVTWPYSDEHTVSDFLKYLRGNRQVEFKK